MLRGLECLEGEIGRETPSDEIRNRCRERIDEYEEGKKSDCPEDGVGLGNLSPLFKMVQDRILCQLDDKYKFNDNRMIGPKRV